MIKPTRKSPSHGHHRRKENRDTARKAIYEMTLKVCNECCDSFEFDLKKDEIPDQRVFRLYEKIYRTIYQTLNEEFGGKTLKESMHSALIKRSIFFQKINIYRKHNGLKVLPAPSVAHRPKRPKNTADFNQFEYLKTAQEIHQGSIDKWRSKNRFTDLDTVTWILYCLIMYAGVNDKKILEAVFEYLRQNKPIQSLSKEMLYIPVEITSTTYANKSIEVADSEDVLLYYSRWVFIDDVTRLWLAYFEQQKKSNSDFKFPKYRQCINKLSEFIGKRFSINSYHKTDFLNYIPIFWKTLPNVRLDEQSTQLLIGKQTHTALTEEQWQLYLQPLNNKRVSLSLDDFESLNIQRKSSTSQTKTLDNYHSDIVKDIKSIIHLNSSNRLTEELFRLKEQTHQISHLMLIQWVIDLKSENNKASTLVRYLSEIGNAFIANTRDTDLSELHDHHYEYIYDAIVSEKNPLKMDYTKTVLHSFHKTLRKSFQAPDVVIERRKDPQMVKSRLISASTYHTLLQSIERQTSIDKYYVEMLFLITVILYRTGLRISELLGLRISDVERDTRYSQFNIIVRPNSQRSLKSDDATRRICLNALLKPKEIERFKEFLQAKQQHKTNIYLFTLLEQQEPIPRHSVEQPIKKLLGPKFANISLHSFRHNAISNMAVILKCPHDVVTIFTDYTEEEALNIKHHFLGTQRAVSGNYWDALMEFAGHADLNTTFASYIHTGDLICASQLAQAEIKLPVGLVMKLTGKEKRSFNQHNAKALEDDIVNLYMIRKLINPLLNPIPISVVNSKVSHNNKKYIGENVKHEVNKKNTSIFGNYDRDQIQSLLTMMEDGKKLEESHSLGFEYEDALEYYERALELAKTGKLINASKRERSGHILIAPTLPRTEKEKALIRDAFRKIEKLYQTDKGKQDLKFMLEVFENKVNRSHSDLRFKFKEKDVFYEFLDIVMQIIPNKHWQVNICAFNRKPNKQRSRGDNKHALEIDEIKTSQIIKAFKADYPKLANKLTSNISYSGYSVSVSSPFKVGNNYRASNVLRYVCHTLLILSDKRQSNQLLG